MQLETNPTFAWICVLLGAAALLISLTHSLKKQRCSVGQTAAVSLIPAALGLLFARGGYALLQWEDNYASFHWCFSTGLLGMAAGTALAARRAPAARVPSSP